MENPGQLKSQCLRDFRQQSNTWTDADETRFNAAFARFLTIASERGLTLQDLESLSRNGVQFDALIQLMESDSW